MDRKKPKVKRQGLTVPFIRYHSCTMPLVQDITSQSSSGTLLETILSSGGGSEDKKQEDDMKMDFTDTASLLETFEKKEADEVRLGCPITYFTDGRNML